MLSLIVSAIVYFIAAHYLKQRMEEYELPEGFTRKLLVFCLALFIASIVGAVIAYFSPDSIDLTSLLALPG